MTSALIMYELLTAAPSDRASLNLGRKCDQKVRTCMRQMVRKLREATRRPGCHNSCVVTGTTPTRWHSAAVVQRAQRALLDHIDGGVFQRAELTPDCHLVAERLLIQLMQLTLRAADALHLALTAASNCATMLTYDLHLAKAAMAIGLAVYPILRENSIATPP